MAITTITMTSPAFEASSTWADSPFALIPTPLAGGQAEYNNPNIHGAELMAHEMSHLHNMIIRGLNAIWQQAPQVTSESDIRDFLQFCLHWHDTILHHHDTEKEMFFPALEALAGKPGCMETNVEQHRAFEEGLERLKKYCTTTSPSAYSGGALRAVINSFGHILAEHLGDEIPTLLALREYDSDKLKAVWKKSGEYAKSHGDTSVSVPFMIGCFDKTYQGQACSEFSLPFFVFWINDFVFSRKFSNCWKFLPCDSRSHPRELAFAPQKKQ